MRSAIIAVGFGVLGLACAKQVGTASVTSAGAPLRSSPNDNASLRIADELCSRASSCSEIGEGAKYRSEEACQSDQGARLTAQGSQWACTPSQDALDKCLAAVRGEKCETIISRVDQLEMCKSRAVCGKAE